MPAAMKVAVATSERCEKRLTPHTPWPLVHPLPHSGADTDPQPGNL